MVVDIRVFISKSVRFRHPHKCVFHKSVIKSNPSYANGTVSILVTTFFMIGLIKGLFDG